MCWSSRWPVYSAERCLPTASAQHTQVILCRHTDNYAVTQERALSTALQSYEVTVTPSVQGETWLCGTWLCLDILKSFTNHSTTKGLWASDLSFTFLSLWVEFSWWLVARSLFLWLNFSIFKLLFYSSKLFPSALLLLFLEKWRDSLSLALDGIGSRGQGTGRCRSEITMLWLENSMSPIGSCPHEHLAPRW